MFDEVPNRRITQRRQSLKDALVATICLVAGGGEAIHSGRIGWNTLFWAIVFILSVSNYWRGRHEDPWDPPDVDGKERHYGALDQPDASLIPPRARKY
jgi:hypothetical protein